MNADMTTQSLLQTIKPVLPQAEETVTKEQHLPSRLESPGTGPGLHIDHLQP